MIRIVIVDDKLTFRAAFKTALENDPDMQVVGRAKNGAEAIDLVRTLRPDLVTLDVLMSDSDGFELVEQIMTERPTPIVVITSGDREAILFRALAAGALDVIIKPKATPAALRPIIDRLKILAHAHPRRVLVPSPPPPAASGTTPSQGGKARAARTAPNGPLVILASSAGGPQALLQVLSGLPADFPAPVLVVQHIAAGFARGLAQWLDQTCSLSVRVAETNTVPSPGFVLVAPDDAHLVLGRSRRIVLDRRTSVPSSIRPAADLTLRSAAALYGKDLLAVVLTGMGRDGALGVEAVKAHGGQVIVQDEATSAVYGMPQASRPFADAELPLESIAGNIIRFVHDCRA